MSCRRKTLSSDRTHFHKFYLLGIPPKICKMELLHLHNKKKKKHIKKLSINEVYEKVRAQASIFS